MFGLEAFAPGQKTSLRNSVNAKRFSSSSAECPAMTANAKPSVAHLCDSLLQAYKAKGLDFTGALQPGLSGHAIVQIASSHGLQLAPELFELYQWRNGSTGAQPTDFPLANKAFLPLEAALSQRETMLKALHPKDREDPTIDGLIPFASSDDEWYAIAGATVQGHRPVFLVLEEPKPDFESLEAMLKSCIDWVNEPDWSPTAPPTRAMEIWYRNNPNMDL